jgi:predicted nucleic acid-binding protein
MELIDTSAWVELLRGTGSPAHHAVRDILRERPGEVVTTEPVVMELLAGASNEAVWRQLDQLTNGLRLLTLDGARDYRDAASAYRAVRAGGKTVRRLLDCLIAAVATRTGATLVHWDRDFDVLAEALPDLSVRSLL